MVKLPTRDDIRKLHEEQGLSMRDAHDILLKEAIIDSIEQAKTFAEAKQAILLLVRNVRISPPHPASWEARNR